MNKNILVLLSLYVSLTSFMHAMIPNEQLLDASMQGNIEQAKRCIIAGANVNTTYPSYDWALGDMTPLHIAALYGNRDVVNLLINCNANVNVQDSGIKGSTPLHHATVSLFKGEKEEIAKLLISKGADINALNIRNMTPLHEAVNNGYVSMVKLLVEYGANKNLKNNHKETALDIAKRLEEHEIINILTEVPSLKHVSARALRKSVRQSKLTLEQVKNTVSEELYELVVEYL